MELGSLDGVLATQEFSVSQLVGFARDISLGMQELHSKNIIHR
jgi:serine/threonine protein kinase